MNRQQTFSMPSSAAVVDRFSRAFARRCAIDLRALAVFRMLLGTLLIVDLLGRSRSLVAFYTDAGVLPRRALFSDYSNVYSLHAISGEAWVQVLLFLVAGVFAGAVLVGYRTRLSMIVSWLLLLSLHARNPMVLNAGDEFLIRLCFWAIFLPLGERWAIDARGSDRERSTVASIATLAILLQVLVMYVTNAVHKSQSEMWMRGDAVAYVMQADQLTVLLGNVLASYPALLEWVTVLWVALLFSSPLLFLLTGLRRAVFVTLFVGMHLGMAVTMQLILFPFASVAGLLLFYPPLVWDGAVDLAQRIDVGPISRFRPASIDDALEALPSPARVRAAFAAVVPSGTNVTAAVSSGSNAEIVQRASNALARGWRTLLTVLPYLFLVFAVLSSVASVGVASVPAPVERTLDRTQMEQNWEMFAPVPTHTTRWYTAPGQLENGTIVDVFHESERSSDRPPKVENTYPTGRWRKYLNNVRFADNTNHRSYAANYLCERWNRRHDTPVERLKLIGYDETVDPYEGTSETNEHVLVEYECDGPFV